MFVTFAESNIIFAILLMAQKELWKKFILMLSVAKIISHIFEVKILKRFVTLCYIRRKYF